MTLTPYYQRDGRKPRLLDLGCKAGGASKGLHDAGFDVTGIDIKPQPHYPFAFIQGDMLTCELDGFDAFWASPPCQAWMDTNGNGRKQSKHPRLIAPIRERLMATGKPYIIENVHKAPLKASVMLCGTMFGLRVIRHRYFETSFPGPLSPFSCNHWGTVAAGDFAAVYAFGGKGHRHGSVRDARPEPCKVSAAEAMGIDWMDKEELHEAVPPAYSEFLGKYLLSVVSQGVLE